ncbi:MAG: cbb3-type cytochrome oxidase assembly protein [Elusimicrobia bacterium]|nr:cbb3-type cytochrome oxidase assembly protein [Elusimicrobiota bacterium]
MNCSQCLAATVGWLNAYWLTLSVSLCVAVAAALVFWWHVRSGQWRDGEKAKFDMMKGE